MSVAEVVQITQSFYSDAVSSLFQLLGIALFVMTLLVTVAGFFMPSVLERRSRKLYEEARERDKKEHAERLKELQNKFEEQVLSLNAAMDAKMKFRSSMVWHEAHFSIAAVRAELLLMIAREHQEKLFDDALISIICMDAAADYLIAGEDDKALKAFERATELIQNRLASSRPMPNYVTKQKLTESIANFENKFVAAENIFEVFLGLVGIGELAKEFSSAPATSAMFAIRGKKSFYAPRIQMYKQLIAQMPEAGLN
jgi:tetratricopeptide (TPR) repeat protein